MGWEMLRGGAGGVKVETDTSPLRSGEMCSVPQARVWDQGGQNGNLRPGPATVLSPGPSVLSPALGPLCGNVHQTTSQMGAVFHHRF